uniref:Uncharacterized protein n=1 Tax=Sphaerodactylus townsendi TaxID=933632 RepID=A0ACB8EQW6_9SAUR
MEGNLCDWISSLLCEVGGGGGGKRLLHLCHHSHCPRFLQTKSAHMGKEACGETVTPPQKTINISPEKQYSLKLWTFSAVMLCVVQAPKEPEVKDDNVAPLELSFQEQRKSHKEIWC